MLVASLLLISNACNKDDIFTLDTLDQKIEARDTYADIVLLPDGFQPEGIVVGDGHEAYVGSIFSGAILKIDLRTGYFEELVQPSFVPVVGLSYDQRTKYLFAARGFAGIVSVFDSNSGEHKKDYLLTPGGPPPATWINDLIVTKKAVYVTDSFREYMYKIPLSKGGALPAQSEVEEILLSGDFVYNTTPSPPFGLFFNANGIVSTPNGKHLFIAHSDFGLIYHVNPNTGEATLIDFGGQILQNADGLHLDPAENGYTLYAVMNIFNVVAKTHINADLVTGNIVEMITDSEFKIPTTVAEFGNGLYVVNARFDVAPPFGPAPDENFDIVRIEK